MKTIGLLAQTVTPHVQYIKQPLARKMLQNVGCTRASHRVYIRKEIMNRFRQAWTAAALLAAFVFSGAMTADAQQANSRAVRDAVRSLNSKLEDFEFNLREQMRSGSADNADLSNVSDDIRGLRDATY